MGAYKLLALDMDGTLLDSHKHVLSETKAAVDRLASRGVAIAYSTGRNPVELSDYTAELPGIRYASCISGGLVCDLARHQTIFVRPFDTPLALKVVAAGHEAGAMVQLLCTNASVTRRQDVQRMTAFDMAVYQEMYERLCTYVDDQSAYVREHPGEVCKINLYHHTPEERACTRAKLASLPLQLADAEVTSLECTPAGVSKAEGLAKLCEHLAISLDEVVAVGDAPNDTQALEVAGCAVAMGNATPDIKALADVVVADNDHNGIVEVIDRFF